MATKKPLKIALEFDDFGPKNHQLPLLEELKEHYPKLKVTMFTVPWDIRFGEHAAITLDKFQPWVDAVKKFDWIEIALHGLTHIPLEFSEISYEGAKKRIIIGERMLENRDIKFAKIFKAPHWSISEEGKKAAEDLGYSVVEDHYYNWNLIDDMPNTNELLIAHGHVQDVMGNGIAESMHKLMKLPTDTEFYYLSEIL
jgi:hypothetical protein